MPMREVFNITRYDRLSGSGCSARFKRGAAQPDITGDFDTGVGPAIDGPYANHGDDGEVRGERGAPYFSNLDATGPAPKTNGAMFSPNRVIPSAGVFGSLPSGVADNVPWQTLLFRPDLELSKAHLTATASTMGRATRETTCSWTCSGCRWSSRTRSASRSRPRARST